MEQDKETEENKIKTTKSDKNASPDNEKKTQTTVPHDPLMAVKNETVPEPKEKQAEADEQTTESELHGSESGSQKAALDEKNQQVEDYYERLLRTQAEFENYRKRSQRELDEFKNYAQAQLIKDLLVIIDDFQNAITAHKKGSNEEFMKGFELIYKNLYGMLEKEGLSIIKASNEKFDPWKHEAVGMVPTTEYPEHTVIEIVQEGYMFKDRMLRPAKVKVATLPETDKEESNDEGEKNDLKDDVCEVNTNNIKDSDENDTEIND